MGVADVLLHDRRKHWYKRSGGPDSHVGVYESPKAMQKEVKEAAKHGWYPVTSTGDGGHMNVGRTVAGAALTGGLSLLAGGSRSKGVYTVTFRREGR